MKIENKQQNDIKKNFYDNKYSDGVNCILDEILRPDIKVVSFDVFDTLLFRPVSTPADTFRLLENKLGITNFHNMRVTAEYEARKVQEPESQDITFDEIYSLYMKLFGADDKEIERLKKEEKKLEYQFLYPRNTAQFLYECAHQAGKKIIIISDMYLESSFIDSCLRKNGYQYHGNVYVSSETRVTKSSCEMFKHVLSGLALDGIKPQEVLHVGDNKKADVDCARACGMKAMHLPKPIDVRNSCKHLKKLYGYILSDVMNSNNAMLYGFLANLYFDDPFISFDKDSFFDGNSTYMGYWFGPLMTGFILWLNQMIEKNQIEQFLYVWRDSYLPSELMKIVRPVLADRELTFKKIYMGRTLRMPYMAEENNGLFNSFADYPLHEEYSVDYFIRNRLLCKDECQRNEILKIFYRHGYSNGSASIGKFEKYRGFLHELEPYFIKNAKANIELVSEYIDSVIEKEKKTAIFDRSPRGKSSRFLKQYFNIESCCFTTEVYDTPKAKLQDIKLQVESYLEYGTYYVNKMGRVWAMLFERIISDTAPGFAFIEKDDLGKLRINLDSEPTDAETIKANDIVKNVQVAIIHYVQKLTQVLGNYLNYMYIDRQGVFDYTIEVLATPGKCDAILITNISPDLSSIAPIDENTFIHWYEKKFNIKHDAVKKVNNVASLSEEKTCWDKIRTKGYMTAEKMGVRIPAQTLYHFITRKPMPKDYRVCQIEMEVTNYIEKLYNEDYGDIFVLIIGSVPREMGRFFNSLARINNEEKFLFVAAGFLKIPEFFDFPCIGAPMVFSFWGVDWKKEIVRVPEYMKETVSSKYYLKELVQRRMLSGYSESVATVLAYEGHRYYSALIEAISPKCLIVWNNWGKNSVIPAEVARGKGIKVVSAERGFLEGTVMLSEYGYGKDLINLNPEQFTKLKVSEEECMKAKEIIEYQSASGFNRYVQPVNNSLNELRNRLVKEYPTVLLVGAFDLENPGFPYNKKVEDTYSPVFGTSKEALTYVAKIANKNNWNFVYKGHPLMDKINKSSDKDQVPFNVHIVSDININDLIDLADVVVCLVSGLSHVALTRGKPLVELAYTTLKGKGCSYQVETKGDIEEKIKEAIDKGLTEAQREAYIKHIAQVNKYYYYDDLCARPIRYGRDIESALAMLKGEQGDSLTYENSSMDTN